LEAVKNSPHFEAIKSAAIFGSYVNGIPGADSDIDVLIEFEPSAVTGFFALSDIKNNFDSFLQKSVDLLTPAAMSKYFRDEILSQAETVYEKRRIFAGRDESHQ
jgi:predicted nucleotidyltransferase